MARKLVVVSAGLSQPSASRLLAERIADATVAGITGRGESADVEHIELRELAVELATALTSGGMATGRFADARDAMTRADGIIVVTPVFAASYSGLLKMFFDLLDADALTGTPTIIAATAGTPRHALVLDHALRPLLTYLRAVVVPTGVFAATDDFGAGDELTTRIARAAHELASLVVQESVSVAGFAAGQPPRTSGDELTLQSGSFADLLRGHTG